MLNDFSGTSRASKGAGQVLIPELPGLEQELLTVVAEHLL